MTRKTGIVGTICVLSLLACRSVNSMGNYEKQESQIAQEAAPSSDAPKESAALANAATLSPVQMTERGLGGWNIVGGDYLKPNPLDGLSIEWDYFMIHDREGKFTGIIGNTLTDPRQRLSGRRFHFGAIDADVMPSGANLSFIGMFADGTKVSDFINFPPQQTEVSAGSRAFSAKAPDGTFTEERPQVGATPAEDRILLSGQTKDFSFELEVAPDWLDIVNPDPKSTAPFAARTSNHIGVLPGEHWTVRMIWPRTLVHGTIKKLATGEVLDVSGHGYRENSWGRWAFVLSGWDFGIFSDDKSGVQWAWQSYHTAKDLDTLDLAFYDNAQRRKVAFRVDSKQFGWYHPQWHYDPKAKGCVPDSTHLVANNGEYKVTADITIGDRQVPMLSSVTFLTKIYFIQEQFPRMKGAITRVADGSLVTNFSGIMGGEFSLIRSGKLDLTCRGFPQKFSQPLPK